MRGDESLDGCNRTARSVDRWPLSGIAHCRQS
jgi:hypothetical protein